jgi:hypothetical protein
VSSLPRRHLCVVDLITSAKLIDTPVDIFGANQEIGAKHIPVVHFKQTLNTSSMMPKRKRDCQYRHGVTTDGNDEVPFHFKKKSWQR